MNLTLPTDSAARKDIPVLSGCLNYAPAAIAWFARISVIGDRKHNPENAGNPPFHARGKSMDHGDCIIRHTMDIEDLKAYIKRTELVQNNSPAVAKLLEEAAYRFWRAGVELQQLCEQYDGAPLAPGARLPEDQQTASPGFADRVRADYETLQARHAGLAGLVAGSAAAKPYTPPALPQTEIGKAVQHGADRELKREEAMKRRVRDSSFPDTALETGDQIDERYGNGH